MMERQTRLVAFINKNLSYWYGYCVEKQTTDKVKRRFLMFFLIFEPRHILIRIDVEQGHER